MGPTCSTSTCSMITHVEETLSHFHNACPNREQQPVVFPHSRQRAGDDGGVGGSTVMNYIQRRLHFKSAS